jgi:capsular exopolysaccharide synthesis family protein
MSRFYDALREASRSSPANGAAGQGESKLPAADGMERLPAEADGQAPPEVTAMESLLEAASDSPPVLDGPWGLGEAQEMLDAMAPVQHPPVATTTPVRLNPKARILPHITNPIILEHYRRLRTKLLQEQTTRPFRSLLVTSPGPGDGKSVTVMNLGFSFAMLSSFPVLLVDGDLRRGSLGRWLGVGDCAGLSNLLDGSATLDDVILKCDEFPVHFVLRGNSKSPAAELLNSRGLSSQFRRMTEQYSLVLVDSPPINLMTDTQLLASNTDAVLLIARALHTTQNALKKAVQDLRPFRVVGTVLNGSTRTSGRRAYRRYYESAG